MAKCRMFGRLRIGCVIALAISLSVLNCKVTAMAADTAAEAKKIEDQAAASHNAVSAGAVEDNDPKTEKSSSSSTLLYVGAGVAAATALAIGLSGSSDSSSDEVAVVEPVETKKDPVGADLEGDNWSGRLLLINYKREPVTAVVTQDGTKVDIKTSSAQKYGRHLIGTIKSNGHMSMEDVDTGQTWTTHDGPAKWNRIDLYDYVNNFQDLDNLWLTRKSK